MKKSRAAAPAALALALAFAVALASPSSLSAQVPPGFSIGLVTDLGGIDDRSFNEMAWRGIERFAGENGLVRGTGYSYRQSSSGDDYLPNLSAFGKAGASLVVAPGFLFSDVLALGAARYPRSAFLILDAVALDRNNEIPPNVACALFNEHEGSFLAGVAAGLKAKEAGAEAVGFLGGMRFALIEKYQAGFEQGVRAVFPEARILVEYADSFIDPGEGRALARTMYDEGAAVIYHAAGLTGNGLIDEAVKRAKAGEGRWVIGVDVDQYGTGVYAPGKSVVLTSVLKRVDVAAYAVAALAAKGEFPGGEMLVFGLKEGGMSLPESNPNLSADQRSTIEQYRARIASGELVVSEFPADGSGSSW